MKRSTIVLVQMLVIFTTILVNECSTRDSDAIVFSEEIEVARTVEETDRPVEQQSERPMDQETEREDKRIRDEAVVIGNRNIITVPSRPTGKSCPTCQRLDSRGNCRKIQDCVP